MKRELHSLLRRQLRKHFGDELTASHAGLAEFIEAVDRAYREVDADRALTERSLEMSSNELVQANAELRAVFSSSPDLHLWISAEGRVLNVQCADADHVFLPRSGLLGKTIDSVSEKTVVRAFASALSRVRESRALVSFECSSMVDGERHDFEARLLPLPNGQVLATVRNISDLKEAEDERYRQLAEHIQEVLWVRDPLAQRVLFASPAYETIWGTPREDLYRDAAVFTRAIHADDRARVEAAMPRQSAGGYDIEFRVVRPDGSIRWVRDRAFPVANEAGEVLRITGIAADITDAKRQHDAIAAANDELEKRVRSRTADLIRAKEALEQSQRKYRRLFEDSNDAIFVVDDNQCIVEANKRALRQFRYSFDDIRGKVVTRLFDAAHRDDVLESAAPTDGARGERFDFVRADSTTFYGECSTTAVEIAGAVYQQMLVRDLSAQRDAETALQQSQEQLRQSQKMEAVGRLAGGVAHDFNNLLVVILSYSELAMSALDPDAVAEEPDDVLAREALREDIVEIYRAGERAAALTQQLLAFSRRQMLKPEAIDLNEVVTNMRRLLERLLGEDMTLDTRLTPGLGAALVDKGQMEQMIVNLAVNARDAMPRGGRLCLETRMTCFTNPPPGADIEAGNYATLVVTDEGSGMAPETLERIFEPFFTTKGPTQGTGLGLATVFGIVKQSKGHITVASTLGRGTVFEVFLPFVQHSTVERASEAPLDVPRGSETILLVEDEEMVRRLAERVLRARGFAVVATRDAAEALALLRDPAVDVDLIVTDVVLPGMSGSELSHEARRLRPGVRTLFMSGYNEDSIVRYGLESGTTDLLPKPFTPGVLVSRVRGALDRAADVA